MSCSVDVRPLDRSEFDAWDGLVRTSPCGTVYHDSRWLRNVSEAVGDSLVIMGVFVGDRLVAGLPIQVRGRWSLSLARRNFATPYANVVTAEDVDTKEIAPSIDGMKRRFSCLAVTGSPFCNRFPYGPQWHVRERATYVVDIEDVHDLWWRFSHQLRKDIRKARKTGITVLPYCEPEILYDLYTKTSVRRRLNHPLAPGGFVRMLNELVESRIAKTYKAVTAEGRTCVARLVLYDSDRAYCALVGSDREATKACASELLLWEIFQEFSRTHREIDLVGANISGVADFKRKFRGRLVKYEEATCYRSSLERIAMRSYQRLRRSRSFLTDG